MVSALYQDIGANEQVLKFKGRLEDHHIFLLYQFVGLVGQQILIPVVILDQDPIGIFQPRQFLHLEPTLRQRLKKRIFQLAVGILVFSDVEKLVWAVEGKFVTGFGEEAVVHMKWS